MNRLFTLVLMLAAAGAAGADRQPPDLPAIRQERKLEKRAGLALDYAAGRLDSARKAYDGGDLKQALRDVASLVEAVELASNSLIETGKNPSKSPKHFKKAELATRQLIRRLDTFAMDLSVDERGPVEKARARVQEINKQLLNGIMSGKKRN